jgi:hypothetical protein
MFLLLVLVIVLLREIEQQSLRSGGMIERKESRGFLTVILVLYLSVGATLGRKGDSVTNTHVTQGP